MNLIPWAIAVVLLIALIVQRNLYRVGVRDRHNLTQFIFLLLLEPGACAAQRENFLRFIRKLDAPDCSALGARLLLEMSHHAERVAGDATASISAAIWQVNQTGAHRSIMAEGERK